MRNFTYFRPNSLEQAVALLEPQFGNTELLGGGTDLHDLQKEYVAQPARVISVSGIKGFAGIEAQQQSIRIGAGTTLADIAAHAEIRKRCAGLATAASEIGGPQIRNMGTLGGNLCQRNRCWYFRDEHVNCLLKGGQRCFALDGENRYHAVFSKGHRCVIVHPSTLAPVLIALGASAEIMGSTGRRTVEIAKFFRAPSSGTEREHNLAANEIVVSVTIPAGNVVSASYEVRHKQAYDWPLVHAAVAFENQGGKVANARIVLGHVAPTPHIVDNAAKALNGQAVDDASATAAGRAATQGATPLSQTSYKLRLIEVAVKRAILTAAGAKRYWEA